MENHKPSLLINKILAFNVFHIVFACIILLASLKTIFEALEVSNWALLTLASAEAIAAVLLVFPKFTKAAGIALMIIFFIAIVFAFIVGIMDNLQLIIYFICSYFIVVHGNSLRKHHNSNQ